MRKEKEIAETKSELLQSESVRYQQRLEYIEKQLRDTEQLLEKEKQRTKSLPIDVAEHEEIMKKVEKLTEIEAINEVLNSEKETLENKMKQMETQVESLYVMRADAVVLFVFNMMSRFSVGHFKIY